MANQKLTAYKVASAGLDVFATTNDDVIKQVARILTHSLLIRGDLHLTELIDEVDLRKCFCYALQVVIEQEPSSKLMRESVPLFLTDIIMSMSGIYRGVRIKVKLANNYSRPDCYDKFLDILCSMGMPVGKRIRVDSHESSNVVKVGCEDLGGSVMLRAVDDTPRIEELVVRSLIQFEYDEADKLARVLGHLEYMYVSRDELIREWACSLPVGKRDV